MRIALVDLPNGNDRWREPNRFTAVAPLLTAQGHDVLLAGSELSLIRSPPILTGLNRAVAAAPMIAANALAHDIADLRVDLVIAPLGGGFAQGMLMARSCGEAFTNTRVALWGDTPSYLKFQREDDFSTGIAPLIQDALERQAVMYADALILPGSLDAKILGPLGRSNIPTFRVNLPLPRNSADANLSRSTRAISEIVFCGPMTRHGGLVEFIEAIQKIAARGLLAGRTVTFLGPLRPFIQGLGTEWFGRRAAAWPFPFKVVSLADGRERNHYLNSPDRLGVTVGEDVEELLPLAGKRHVALPLGSSTRRELLDRLEQALIRALEQGAGIDAEEPTETTATLDWPGVVRQIAELPFCPFPHSRTLSGATVCIVHHNRLEYLRQAIQSIPYQVDGQPIEVLVVDNASTTPFIEQEIRRNVDSRHALRVIQLQQAVPQATALNRALVEAANDTVVFLDDDNYFMPDGVERLMRAIQNGGLDIAVTSLDVFDDGVGSESESVGRLIFLGAAHSAGLFFNAFGDTAMAVRRERFMQLGGFHDPGYAYSHLDWATLASAHSAGFHIGALQWPAVRYRRNTARADAAPHKLDQEGARLFVFEAYGQRFNASLLARFAQKLHLEGL